MVVEEVPDSVSGTGEVAVKVKNVGICGSDLHLYQYGFIPADYIMGHEATGYKPRFLNHFPKSSHAPFVPL